MILWIVNKLPKPIRVYLKNGPLKRTLHQKLAEEQSQKIVQLQAEKLQNELSDGVAHRNNEEIEKIISYKKEFLENTKFIAEPPEFQKSFIYPLIVNTIVFLAGLLIGVITQHKDIFTKIFKIT